MITDNHEFVTIRAGYSHPVLGTVEGWTGCVTRTFSVQGTCWHDIELTAGTIESIPPARIEIFVKEKIVFTRIRVAQENVVSSSPDEPASKREKAIESVQHQWHELVGGNITDPTKFASDQAFGDSFDPQRRQMMKTLVAAGIGVLVLSYATCRDSACDNNGTGSWHHGGGFYA